MSTEDRYLLGHDEDEWDRLREQHLVWRHTLLDSLPKHGIGPGARILEVGCGNGALLADLAQLAGPDGRVVGVEIAPAAASAAAAAVAELPGAEAHQGDVMELELGAEFDLVVARWVLSFLRHPEKALRRMLEHVRPGGLIFVQDYNYDAIRMSPGGPSFRRLFEVMPQAYARHGGDAWLATRLPQLYTELGLEWIAAEPHCLAGPPQSPISRWAERFFRQHVHTLVEDGLLSPQERDDVLADWTAAYDQPGSVFFSPLVVNVVARRPSDEPPADG